MGGDLTPAPAESVIRRTWEFGDRMARRESLISRVDHEEAVGNCPRTKGLLSLALSTSGNLLVALRHLFSRSLRKGVLEAMIP